MDTKRFHLIKEKKRTPAARREQLRTTCERLQIPGVIAMQFLAGVLTEADLEQHPDRANWQIKYRGEVALQKAEKKLLKHNQAEQIADAFGVNLEHAFSALNGKTAPSALLELARLKQRSNKKQQTKKERIQDNCATLQTTCDRLQIPAVVALQLLAKIFTEADLEQHPNRARWRVEYYNEMALREVNPQAFRNRQVEQIVSTFDVVAKQAVRVLEGNSPPGALLEMGRQLRQMEQSQHPRRDKGLNPVERRARLKRTCDRLQVPAVVALQFLAGVFTEADLDQHPDRAKWPIEYQHEVALRETRAKDLKRHQAEQIAAVFKISIAYAFNVLSGNIPPGALLGIVQALRLAEQKQQAKEERAENNRTLLKTTSERLQVPVAIAAQVLCGVISETTIASHPWRSRWQAEYEDETALADGDAVEELMQWQVRHIINVFGVTWQQAQGMLDGSFSATEFMDLVRLTHTQAATWHFRVEKSQARTRWNDLADAEQLQLVHDFLDWTKMTQQCSPTVSVDLLIKACAFGLRPEWRQSKRAGKEYSYLVFCEGTTRRVKWRIAPYISKKTGELTRLALYHHNYRHRIDGFHAQRRYGQARELVEYVLDHEAYERRQAVEVAWAG